MCPATFLGSGESGVVVNHRLRVQTETPPNCGSKLSVTTRVESKALPPCGICTLRRRAYVEGATTPSTYKAYAVALRHEPGRPVIG